MGNNKAISACRILATLFIIVCHIITYYTFIPGHAQLGQFFNVGVQMFIIISGYLYGRKSRENRPPETKKFFTKRYLRVAFPSQVWAVIVLLLMRGKYWINAVIVLLNIQGIGWIFKGIKGIDGGPYLSHTWFVTIILICYLLVPVLTKSVGQLSVKKLVILEAAGCLAALFNINILLITLFVGAYFVGAKDFRATKLNTAVCIGMIAAAVFVRLAGHLAIDGTSLYNNVIVELCQDVTAAAILIIVSKITIASSEVNHLLEGKIMTFLDRHSFSIYLVHYIFIAALYENCPLLMATAVFAAAVPVTALALDFVVRRLTGMIERRI